MREFSQKSKILGKNEGLRAMIEIQLKKNMGLGDDRVLGDQNTEMVQQWLNGSVADYFLKIFSFR